ncbi:MAG TPA: dicarboxylate/amino acid:cation symporter [Gemmatimonadaceae bacterium]|nr:dicarboxylate/amino acid:cation symporter [Gemmatimonadaceae bacterium]
MPEHTSHSGAPARGKRSLPRLSPAAAILFAFAAGGASGALLPQFAGAIGPIGTIWVKAISALVVPLVVALLITGIASFSDAGAVGRMGARVVVVFLALLVAGAIVMALVTPWLLTLLGVTPASAGRLGEVATQSAALGAQHSAHGFWDWIDALIPGNPIAAASSGALLPLVIFTIAFGIGATRLAPEPRASLVGFFRAVADVMLELVRWVLWIAPLGVFGLAYALGARTGIGGASSTVSLVILVAIACAIFVCALYIVAVVLGRVPLVQFVRAIVPAQVVGFSSRSSLASLPAMIEAGKTQLALPAAATGFVLPLAVSTFKLGATISIMTSTLFLARVYGVPITPAQIASVAVSAVLLSFSIPGIPGGVFLVIVPVLAGLGIPAEGVGILLAVDVVPDMFRTATNVTADMVAAVIVSRGRGDRASDPTSV